MKIEALKSWLAENGDGYLVIDGEEHFCITILIKEEQVLFDPIRHPDNPPILISKVVSLLHRYPNHEIVTKRICSPLSITTSIVPPSMLK